MNRIPSSVGQGEVVCGLSEIALKIPTAQQTLILLKHCRHLRSLVLLSTVIASLKAVPTRKQRVTDR